MKRKSEYTELKSKQIYKYTTNRQINDRYFSFHDCFNRNKTRVSYLRYAKIYA